MRAFVRAVNRATSEQKSQEEELQLRAAVEQKLPLFDRGLDRGLLVSKNLLPFCVHQALKGSVSNLVLRRWHLSMQ